MAKQIPRERFRIGADENGLGPRLGPMIVTAVLAEVTPEGHSTASRKLRGKVAERLGDSKALLSHGDVSLGEAWARALVERGCGRPGAGPPPQTVAELVHAVSADPHEVLRTPCPKGSEAEAQCWAHGSDAFSAEASLVKTLHDDLDKLAMKGVSIKGVRSKIVCTKRLNEALSRGKNRFTVDLHAMEELILELASHAGDEVHAICGKVGGFGAYSDAFGPLSGRLHSIIEEQRARSQYYFPGLGQIAFVMDADDSDILVSMASLVGKYLREILMDKITSYYRGTGLEVPDASGYHDPVTAAFVKATALVRKSRSIHNECFERRSFAKEGGGG